MTKSGSLSNQSPASGKEFLMICRTLNAGRKLPGEIGPVRSFLKNEWLKDHTANPTIRPTRIPVAGKGRGRVF